MKSKHKPMPVAKLFRLMYEHPNPVTRAVYRDMYFKRISEEASPKTSEKTLEE